MKLFQKPTSTNFYARFYLQGREYRTSCGTSVRRDAEAFARRWRSDIEERVKAGQPANANTPLTTLRDKDVQRARDEGRSPLYIARSIIGRFNNHLIPFFGHTGAVTDDALDAYVLRRKADGARTQTISTELENLKRALRLCRIRGPEFWPKLAAQDPDTKKASKKHDVEVWRAWLAALEGEARDIALFALLTGLRWAELYRAQPEDISRRGEYAVITVREKVKRSRQREVVLSGQAQRLVTCLPFRHDHRKAHRKAHASITLRDCRAAFSTAAGGVDARMADLMMGHSGVPARYIKQDYERMWAAVCGVEHWLAGPASGSVVNTHTSADGAHEPIPASLLAFCACLRGRL